MTTPKDCISALRRAADELGESPTKAQYEELGLTPASATIQRVMGGWNAAKDEAGLETNASRGSRVQPKPDDVALPEGLTWTELSQDQRWHYKNREWNTERSLQRRAELRAWVNELKATAGCSRCSEADPACLDFHHIDETGKEYQITTMISNGRGKESLLDEMAKCEVVCANCHRKVHFEPPDV
ncbi:HNH endonuclease [Halomicroarcula limicola]|uniref:HNH endonuclease n=1 Tax=Haloarcula limicola TaxID=1429915 RepID=A0A8J8C4J8_9EURY|nr:HNH endonuclease [Halomicroarcula limicola]MBV0925676.1 HNH endonuclease [Halomicroarcula limicola]